jgi:uncharacterized membrane-anchored protein YitT (DUF2179 family)
VGDFIALFNIALFSFAILLTNIETAMYSMLTYLSASKTVDFIINGVEEYLGVLIISTKNEEIKNRLPWNYTKESGMIKKRPLH